MDNAGNEPDIYHSKGKILATDPAYIRFPMEDLFQQEMSKSYNIAVINVRVNDPSTPQCGHHHPPVNEQLPLDQLTH